MNDTPTPAPSGSLRRGQLLGLVLALNAITSGSSNFGGFGPNAAIVSPHRRPLPSGGVFEFDFDAGDEFSGTYSGFFTPTGTPNLLNSTVDYIVTGGTGRFLGATGTIEGVGTLDRNPVRPINNLALNGTLNLPAVPEPASWALMLFGFFGLGATLRRRRHDLTLAV